ncbi:MAG: hypothetical protein AAGJ46_17000, partial [Planctomycetota bacterium]
FDISVTDYDVDGGPAISPDGNTILFLHNGRDIAGGTNTIHTMPITGEGTGLFNGIFTADPTASNNVDGGIGNFSPRYSPDGSTIFFVNAETGFLDAGLPIPTYTTDSFNNDPAAGPLFPGAWGNPDWDRLYSVPATGGTPTPITSGADGDLEGALFAITPDGASVVYAPDRAVANPRDRGDERPTLFTVPATGGASTAVPLAPAPNALFSISAQVEVVGDALSPTILFIGDYDTPGKDELYSVPLTGGTPTKINDELHFAGDVRSFEVSPDGSQIAYVANQTTSSAFEVFLKDISGAGTGARVNLPAPDNSGGFDVGDAVGPGTVRFSPDGETIYYRGDLTNDGASDIYVVDTTDKAGLVSSVYTYVGPDGGDFFDEANWEDAEGKNPTGDPINTLDNELITGISLVVDGDVIGGSRTVRSIFDGQLQFGVGGSLEIINGATVDFSDPDGSVNAELDFDPRSGLKIVNGSLIVDDDIFLDGTIHLEDALLESLIDDVEFQDEHDSTIINSTVRAGNNLIFDQSIAAVTGSSLIADDNTSIRFSSSVTVTDTELDMTFDVEPLFTHSDGEGSSLTLKGSSVLNADSVNEGVDLILEDTAVANLGSLDTGTSTSTPPSIMQGTNTVMADAGFDGEFVSLIIINSDEAVVNLASTTQSSSPAGELIINGLTDESYDDNPDAFNIVNWDAVSPVRGLSIAGAPLGGDYNGDGVVDAADYTIWRDSVGASAGTLPNDIDGGIIGVDQYLTWRTNFGYQSGPAPAAVVPEPASLLFVLAAAAGLPRRRRLDGLRGV